MNQDRPNPDQCPLEHLASAIGGKWRIKILGHLFLGGSVRTSELRRRVRGISEKVLCDQLHALITIGLVDRLDFQTVPPHVEYRLTQKGMELSRHLHSVAEWSAKELSAQTI